MKESNCPISFWDYCMERRARINNLTAKNMFSRYGSNPRSSLTGEEGDILGLCQYNWYQWCYYREGGAKFPFNCKVIGRVLDPATGAGNEMAKCLLKANGSVVPRRTLRPLQVDELHSPTGTKKRETFDDLIERRWGTSTKPSNVIPPKDEDIWEE